MDFLTRSVCAALLVVTCLSSALAEEGVLVLQVSSTLDRPIPGVILSAAGDSSMGAATDVAGKTRIRLAQQTKPGHEVELVIVRSPQDLVFISPWNSRVTVPPFENSTQLVVKVVLAECGNRQLLEYPAAQSAMVATINATNAPRAGDVRLTEEQRQMNLAEAARAFGFTPAEVDRAICALGEKASDPYQLGLVALYKRDYPEASRLLAESVEGRKRRFEEARGELADAHFFLGQSFYEQGRYREAVSALQQVAGLRPDDAATLIHLGIALHSAGEYGRAEEHYQQALKLHEKELGPEHPKVAILLNSLAQLYVEQGKYGEAEPIIKRALTILKEQLGPDHPDVANSLNTLAVLYLDQGKYGEAEPLYRQALVILEKQLGPEHPNVAGALSNLAALYREQGKNAAAEPLIKQALAIIDKQFGPEHPNIAVALNNLSLLYTAQGKYGEAEPLYRRALVILEKRLGPKHPHVALILDRYAELLRKMNRIAEAQEMEARAKKIKTKN